MIQFRVLGTVDLRARDGAEVRSVLSQPKRLALLAYLAVATPRGFHRRSTLLGLFWPELDEARARGALNQALYFLREALGRDVLVRRGTDEVGVADELLACDAVAFERALDAGAPAEALELYRGDLLPGLFLSDALEWERWLELERERLRGRAAAAAWTLAQEAASRAAGAEAAYWAQRAQAILPDDGTRLRRLMTLLEGLGDRAGALRLYTAAADRLARDYELEPDAETRALAEAIRTRDTPLDRLPTADESPPAPPAETPARGPGQQRPPGRRRRALATLAASTAVAVVVWASLQGATSRDRTPAAAAPPDHASPATEEYLMGRHQRSKLDPPSVLAAKEHLERALDRDPTFAPAWSGLGDVLQKLAAFALLPAADAFPRSRAAAERALELDPFLAEAHAVLATALTLYYWDNDDAERHYRRALALDPGAADIHRAHAAHLRTLGRFDEALQAVRTAKELDPLSAFHHAEEGLILYLSRDYEASIARYEGLLRIAPDHPYAHVFLALAKAQQGRYEEALADLEATDPHGRNPDDQAVRGYIHGRSGRTDAARRVLRQLDSLGLDPGAVAFQKAAVHLSLGEHDQALDRLEESAERENWQIRLIGVEPTFDPLRERPRFHALLRKVNLDG